PDARAQDSAAARKNTPASQFPNLASVPDRPRDVSDTGQAGRVQDGLVADRAQAKHVALSGNDNRPGAAPSPVIASPPPPPRSSGPGATAGAAPPLAPPPPAVADASTAPPPPPAISGPPSAPSMAQAPAVPGLTPPMGPAMQEPSVSFDKGTEIARAAFEAALNQSGGVVRQPAGGGIRDMNRSNVVAASGRNVMPLPPAARGGVSLQPPGSAAPGMAAGGGRPAATIPFDNNSSKLSESDLNILQNIVNIKGLRGGVVRVVGHASRRTRDVDPLNHRLVNFRLSMARANAVAAALTQMGIPAKDIVVEAHADNEPLFYEFMPSGEAGNRRAEIYLDY
ncbi:MAG: hypothetical protein RL477_2339, partial [Pseudomonadota bacterium]